MRCRGCVAAHICSGTSACLLLPAGPPASPLSARIWSLLRCTSLMETEPASGIMRDSACKRDRRSRSLGGLGARGLTSQLPKDIVNSADHGMIAILQSKRAPLLAPLLMQSHLDVCYAVWLAMTDMLQNLESSQMSCFDILIPVAPGHAAGCMQRARAWLHSYASAHLQGCKEPYPVPLAAWCPPEMSSGWQQGSPWCIRGWPSLLTRLVHSPVWRQALRVL